MTTKKVPVITMDGTSGSGKGTMAQKLAQHMGWHLLDSGALYRVVAFAATQHGIALTNEQSLDILTAHLDVQFVASSAGAASRILFEGVDVSQAIRSESMGQMASKVAVLPSVRSALLGRQRAFREWPGLVADGRDMGSVIFPDANCKLFLQASLEVRAERRYRQLKAGGINVKFASILDDMMERDQRDRERVVAPLLIPEHAIVIDTDQLSVEQVLQRIMIEVEKVSLFASLGD
jgi:cytidylate kinase